MRLNYWVDMHASKFEHSYVVYVAKIQEVWERQC